MSLLFPNGCPFERHLGVSCLVLQHQSFRCSSDESGAACPFDPSDGKSCRKNDHWPLPWFVSSVYERVCKLIIRYISFGINGCDSVFLTKHFLFNNCAKRFPNFWHALDFLAPPTSTILVCFSFRKEAGCMIHNVLVQCTC